MLRRPHRAGVGLFAGGGGAVPKEFGPELGELKGRRISGQESQGGGVGGREGTITGVLMSGSWRWAQQP